MHPVSKVSEIQLQIGFEIKPVPSNKVEHFDFQVTLTVLDVTTVQLILGTAAS